jgi:acyl-CoA synthetase (AMP-forming)/AMP-acid ligase II
MAGVSELISFRGRQRPDEPAFVTGADGRALSWLALARHAERVRRLAGERRLPAHARLGLVIDDPLTFTAAYLAALAAGLTAVPVDPRLTPSELGTALDRLRVDVVLADEPVARPDELVARPDLAGRERWIVGRSGPVFMRRRSSAAWPSTGTAMRPAVLLTSSGTTGSPKGIGLSQWQLLHAARRVARHHRLGPGERGYNPLPLFHVNAQVIGLLATLVSGASLVLDRRFDPEAYWARVAEWSPTWLNTVPAVIAALVGQPAPAASVAARIRFARSASAPLPAATAREFTARTGIGVLETYGMTEAAGQITANPLDPALRREGSVGLPVEVGLVVHDAAGDPVPAGVRGVVALRGRQVTAAYVDLTAVGPEAGRTARDGTGWLPTGDVGWRDEDGFVYLAGRADDVINRGGEKVFPQEVENVLLTHPAVRSAAVVAAPHERLGQVPVAFVTTDPHWAEPGLVEGLHRLCTERLARYKRPTVIEIAAALPTGPTGKVLRRRLRDQLPALGGAR